MKSNIPTYVSYPILGSVIGLILFQIPLLGVLLFLPLLPLAGLYDVIIPGEFGSTGQHVEIGFAWIIFKTWQAWLFYGSFFFLVGLLLGTFTHYYRRIKKQAKDLISQDSARDTIEP
jgi:hypothetical protein